MDVSHTRLAACDPRSGTLPCVGPTRRFAGVDFASLHALMRPPHHPETLTPPLARVPSASDILRRRSSLKGFSAAAVAAAAPLPTSPQGSTPRGHARRAAFLRAPSLTRVSVDDTTVVVGTPAASSAGTPTSAAPQRGQHRLSSSQSHSHGSALLLGEFGSPRHGSQSGGAAASPLVGSPVGSPSLSRRCPPPLPPSRHLSSPLQGTGRLNLRVIPLSFHPKPIVGEEYLGTYDVPQGIPVLGFPPSIQIHTRSTLPRVEQGVPSPTRVTGGKARGRRRARSVEASGFVPQPQGSSCEGRRVNHTLTSTVVVAVHESHPPALWHGDWARNRGRADSFPPLRIQPPQGVFTDSDADAGSDCCTDEDEEAASMAGPFSAQLASTVVYGGVDRYDIGGVVHSQPPLTGNQLPVVFWLFDRPESTKSGRSARSSVDKTHWRSDASVKACWLCSGSSAQWRRAACACAW